MYAAAGYGSYDQQQQARASRGSKNKGGATPGSAQGYYGSASNNNTPTAAGGYPNAYGMPQPGGFFPANSNPSPVDNRGNVNGGNGSPQFAVNSHTPSDMPGAQLNPQASMGLPAGFIPGPTPPGANAGQIFATSSVDSAGQQRSQDSLNLQMLLTNLQLPGTGGGSVGGSPLDDAGANAFLGSPHGA